VGLFRLHPVKALLRSDRWAVAEARTPSGPALLRYRTPVLSSHEVNGYGHVLKIVWAYAPEDSAELPTRAQSEEMEAFEDRFCEAVEGDAHAILTAVLTLDGARQWVFYTGDIPECGRRLEAMPQEEEPYPIELTTESDPSWSYLRDEILKRVPWREHGASEVLTP
jgi:hypothetical protein